MKTTFDLPDPLLRRAKAVAADEGRPLRDFVADALSEKLAAYANNKRAAGSPSSEWKAFSARLQAQPDGSFINPQGIDNEALDEVLDTIRQERKGAMSRNPFEDAADFMDEVGVGPAHLESSPSSTPRSAG